MSRPNRSPPIQPSDRRDCATPAWSPLTTAVYNTISGLGITLGNLATGALWDFARRHDALWLPWTVLTATGPACAASVAGLARTGRLGATQPQPVAA